jgi:Fe(3+) dicitrate transport protein
LLIVTALVPPAVAAADAGHTPKLPTVEVIGQEEALWRLPGSGHILGQDELYRSHVFTINEALRKVPGLYVRDEEGFGMRPNIAIRGMNPTRSTKTLLLEDGLPLSYAPYGDNASYYHPPVDRFERIEVLKGANQLLFGPHTIAGTINYITPAPPDTPGGYASFTGGNRGYLNGHFNYGGWYGSTGGVFDYLHKQGDGARDNTELEIDDVNLKGVHQFSPTAAIIARLNYFREDSTVTYSGLTEAEMRNFGLRYNPFKNDEFSTERYGASLTHEWDLTADVTATTSVYWSHFDRDWWRQSSNSVDGQHAGCNATLTIDGVTATFTAHRAAGRRVDPGTQFNCAQGRLRYYYTWGVEPRLDIRHQLFGFDNEFKMGLRTHHEEQFRQQQNGASPTARSGILVEDNERDTSAKSVFLQNRIELGAFSLTPAVRYESISYERRNLLTGAQGNESLSELIPALSVGYTPHTGLAFFAGVHAGFAPPRVEDRIDNAGGSVDIDAEQSVNVEIGMRSELRDGFNVDMTWFRNDFDNLIAVGSIAGGGVPLAQGEALFEGLELFARVDSDQFFGTPWNAYVQAAWTYLWEAGQSTPFIRVDNGLPVAGSAAGNRQPYAPEHTFTGMVGYAHPMGFDMHLEIVYVDSQFADFANFAHPGAATGTTGGIANSLTGQFGAIDDHTVLNFAATYSFKPHGLDVFVGVKNLLDNDYIVDRTRGILPGAPRLIHAGLKYSF